MNDPMTAPTPRFVALADCAPQPWRNGGGTTRELLTHPAGPDWRWRLSVADIDADGPFSAWPGVARWFAVVEGAGVELELPSGRVTLRPGDAPLAFDGGAVPGCRLLAGPTRDLNLMLRGTPGRLEQADAGATWRPDARHAGLYARVAGTLHAGSARWPVAAATLAWFDVAPAEASFVFDARDDGPGGWWIAAGEAETRA